MIELKCVICNELKSIDNFSKSVLKDVLHKDVHQICFDCLDKISKIDFKSYDPKEPTGINYTCRQCTKEKDSSLMLSKTLCNECYLETCRDRTKEIKDSIKEKKCSNCERILDVSKFSNKSDSSDGYNCKCRDCVKEYNLLYKAKNRENINKIRRDDRKNDPTALEKEQLKREKNRDKIREFDRSYSKKRRNKIVIDNS